MSGSPLLTPSYLFNVSFALVTIQISSSFSTLYQWHLSILLVSSLIIRKTMFNNNDSTVTVCPNRKHSFPAKDYIIVIANNTVASLFRMLPRWITYFSALREFLARTLSKKIKESQCNFDPFDWLIIKIFPAKIPALKFVKIEIDTRIAPSVDIPRSIFKKSVRENEVTTSPIGHANLSREENGIDMLTEANLKVNGL